MGYPTFRLRVHVNYHLVNSHLIYLINLLLQLNKFYVNLYYFIINLLIK